MGHGFHSYGSTYWAPKTFASIALGTLPGYRSQCAGKSSTDISCIYEYIWCTHTEIYIYIYLFIYAHLCAIFLIKLEDVPLPSLLKRKYDQYSVLETLCLYTFLSVKAFFGSVKSPCFLGVELGFCSDGKRVSESAAFQCISLDLSGKATENQVFSNEIWAFPVDFPFRHSIE